MAGKVMAGKVKANSKIKKRSHEGYERRAKYTALMAEGLKLVSEAMSLIAEDELETANRMREMEQAGPLTVRDLLERIEPAAKYGK